MVKLAGVVLARQRPGTAKGVWFMTVEDETGCANLVIFPNINAVCRKALLGARLFMAEGVIQIEGEVIHVIVNAGYDLSKLLRSLTVAGNVDLPLLTLSRADEKVPLGNKRLAAQKKLFRIHEISGDLRRRVMLTLSTIIKLFRLNWGS